ncbi:MAG TPA: tetratricopeptide repeat protein [Alphaproteobacteria bacterium]|nr:tetratricopeptide repeat protein [Alphaproteobacteria bacterium]
MDDRYEAGRFDDDEPFDDTEERLNEDDRLTKAQALFQQAYEFQMAGKYEQAIRLYQQSIAAYPTAEAHTFLGWTYSFQGRLDDAIAACHRAIQVDPDFGNPYNDIGVYLMQKGRLDDAMPWLEKAKLAPRYEPRHFPYINLGRIYLAKGDWLKALREFEQAVEIMPNDPGARKALAELRGRLN